jgi:hypothetical protein
MGMRSRFREIIRVIRVSHNHSRDPRDSRLVLIGVIGVSF